MLTLEDLNVDNEELLKQASGKEGEEEAPPPPLSEADKKLQDDRAAVMAPLLGILDGCKQIFWREYVAKGGRAADKEEKPRGKFAYLGCAALLTKQKPTACSLAILALPFCAAASA